MVIEILLYILIMATSAPAGLFLAYLCDDEIKRFRKYILSTVHSMAILAVILAVSYFNWAMILSLIYSMIVLSTMIIKSY